MYKSSFQGYKEKEAYLATQAPLENTVADVWRMVWEKQSSCIVLLCQLEEDGREVGRVVYYRDNLTHVVQYTT